VIEGQVAYTFPSDGRFKTHITESIKGLSFIMKLRPVAYNFQTKKYEAYIHGATRFASSVDYSASENLRHNGFIAQEVEQAARESGFEFDGVIVPKNATETYGLSYSQFVVPLVKAVQEQQAMIQQQQQQIDELIKEVRLLKQRSK
jgi:trimeric autotransporter adhesin